MPDVERHSEVDIEDVVSGYRITKPFIPHVLDAELAAELGRDKVDITFSGDPAQASEEQPVIALLPADLTVKQVGRVLAAHDPTEVDLLADIKAKLGRHEELSPAEITMALRSLLGVSA